MARGGKREGAGGKPGQVSVKSQEAAKAIVTDGKKTPLEVMIEAMRWAYDMAIADQNPASKNIWLETASAHAAKAAPYIHSKLATMEVKNAEGETFKTSSSLAEEDHAIIQRYLNQTGAKK